MTWIEHDADVHPCNIDERIVARFATRVAIVRRSMPSATDEDVKE